jgi:hypothetical protein
MTAKTAVPAVALGTVVMEVQEHRVKEMMVVLVLMAMLWLLAVAAKAVLVKTLGIHHRGRGTVALE